MLTLRAAVYARYSSENQRPESIDDQISSCNRLAAKRGFTVDESLVFSDEATSGARTDRKGLASLLAAGSARRFDVVLVDDLSRLARDNYLMLSLMAELHFNGVRVISVADGLDTGDEEAKLGIQIRGICWSEGGGSRPPEPCPSGCSLRGTPGERISSGSGAAHPGL
jgi:DNA invertase Pin-like site-specific DNA recombinase